MILLPAVDLLSGQAVRLLRGAYDQVTVYDRDPLNTVRRFEEAGAEWLHLVDLDGAKSGGTDNLPAIRRIVTETRLRVEVGGGIRSLDTIRRYLELGVARVILGTAAVVQPGFAEEAVRHCGEKIAVGADLKDGFVAVKGWTETTPRTCADFCAEMERAGVQTLICTDVSRDGAMRGTNLALYRTLSETCGMRVIASGGVSSLSDVQALTDMGLYGAIVGKAYYTGAVDLRKAIAIGRGAAE